MRVSATHKYTCDQKIGQYYVEVFGYGKSDRSSRSDAYNRRRAIKEALYKKLGLNLVPIEKDVFLKPYPEIERQLDQIFFGLGFDIARKAPFDICELAQQAGFIMTEDEVVQQLDRIIQETGTFPTSKVLHAIGREDLMGRISKSGGLNHYREKLGHEPPVKPNDYWTMARTLKMLKRRSDDLGRLPRRKELGGALAHAVDKHGGINHLAGMLGLAAAKKPNGWWKDKELILRLLADEVVPVLGHYPNPKELQNMGRSDLFNAIARAGGFKLFRHLYIRKVSTN